MMISLGDIKKIAQELREQIKGQTGPWALGYRDALRDMVSQIAVDKPR